MNILFYINHPALSIKETFLVAIRFYIKLGKAPKGQKK